MGGGIGGGGVMNALSFLFFQFWDLFILVSTPVLVGFLGGGSSCRVV